MSARKKNDSREKCRLCQSDTDLVDVFDKNIYDSKHLRNFILVTSGVEILETDVVSKKVCHRCCIIAVKSYKYRYNAIETDKMLKKEIGQEYVAPVLPNVLGLDMEIAKKTKTQCNQSVQTDPIPEMKAESDMLQQNRQICATNHRSVNKMLKTSKTIIVPKGILKENISPVIVLDKGPAESYFRKRGEDIDEQIYYCLRILNSMDESVEESSSSRTLNRITFSDARVIYDLIPKEPLRPQVSRKRTSTQPLSALIPSKREKLGVISEVVGSPITTPVSHLNDDSSDRRSPSPVSLLEAKSNDEIFECKVCQKIFDKRIMLHHHMKIHLKCKLCKSKFRSTDDFDEHLNSTCYLSIAKNLPSIKLTKVDEIESMKKMYPQLTQKIICENDIKTECDLEEEEDKVEKDEEDSNEISLKSLLKSAPEATKSSAPNEDIISIDDDSDEDPTFMPSTSEKKTKSSNAKKTVSPHSVSMIYPEIDVKLTNSENALVNEVKGKCKSHDLIVSLFDKYRKISRVDTGVSPDFIPDASTVQCMGAQTNLLNMASELNVWKIPVVISKHSKMSASFVWHEMPLKKKSTNTIDWSNIRPTGIVPPPKKTNVIIASKLPAAPKSTIPVTLNQTNKTIKPPVLTNQTLRVPSLAPTLSSDLLAIPTNALYQTGPTSFALTPSEPIANSTILIQPSIYRQPCVINTTNQVSNGPQPCAINTTNQITSGPSNLIVTTISENNTALVSAPYFITTPIENRSTFTTVGTTNKSMPCLNEGIPNTTQLNTTTTASTTTKESTNPSTLPKYPLLRVRTNLH